MRSLWERVLERPVGDDQDFFFDLDGNSLQAIRLVDEIQVAFGLELSIGMLFDHATVRALVEALDTAAPAAPYAATHDASSSEAVG